ncbi:hypothetical protein DT065_03950 [Salicibibacter kimchii]|uniref:Uncharacterized protein n=1 Tax=Salicibibacter kimchii TaxID=2099786 RepID=A0A345BWC3_9BACI|nr:hypothetical protein DT065_03950 [Salicibibacter kimchii]
MYQHHGLFKNMPLLSVVYNNFSSNCKLLPLNQERLNVDVGWMTALDRARFLATQEGEPALHY